MNYLHLIFFAHRLENNGTDLTKDIYLSKSASKIHT